MKGWGRQVRLLQTIYVLEDDIKIILIASKLKGKALSWFHSKPEHIKMAVDELLAEIKTNVLLKSE